MTSQGRPWTRPSRERSVRVPIRSIQNTRGNREAAEVASRRRRGLDAGRRAHAVARGHDGFPVLQARTAGGLITRLPDAGRVQPPDANDLDHPGPENIPGGPGNSRPWRRGGGGGPAGPWSATGFGNKTAGCAVSLKEDDLDLVGRTP